MEAIKVPLRGINTLKNILIDKNFMDMNYKIQTNDKYGLIAIKKIENLNLKEIENELNLKLNINLKNPIAIDLEITNTNIEKIKKSPTDIKEILKNKLNKEELENLKKSFDIIGDIVIIEIPEELEKYKKEIGKATLQFTGRKTVFMKKSSIKGLTRIRDLELLCGEDNSKTIYKEHGIKLFLDVKNVYFSPRLGTERLRVSNEVKDNEKILDMFTGIGPFPILIAKNHKVNIYGVDINKIAIDCLKENIEINKLKGTIKPIYGDINEVSVDFKKNNEKFNRIIMNLPGAAFKFLDLGFSLIKNNGIIHYYEFGENYNQPIERLNKIAIKHNKEIEILQNRKVKSSSPGMWHLSFDVKIKDKKEK